GNTRKEPSTSGCTSGGVLFALAYAPAVPTTCTPPTTLSPSVVADGLKVCDPATDSSCPNQYTPDINSGTHCPLPLDSTTCNTQQGAVLPSGFVNLSLSANATAGGGSSTTAMTTAQTSSSSNSGIPFQVDTFNDDGEQGATLGSSIFAL